MKWPLELENVDNLPAALSWLAKPLEDPNPFLRGSNIEVDDPLGLLNAKVKLLYLHIGFVSPVMFIITLIAADLPTIFEGQHTASIVASNGKPHLKLRDSSLDNSAQAARIPSDTYRHAAEIDRVEVASLALQRCALGEPWRETSERVNYNCG